MLRWHWPHLLVCSITALASLATQASSGPLQWLSSYWSRRRVMLALLHKLSNSV